MPDKKISQLTERLTTAATDVFPVVYVGATDTEKVKASTIYAYIKNTLVSGIIQATTDTDKFLVQDGTEIKYRTGAEMLGDILPSQTGNNGKVLKTDGTTATWQPDGGTNAVQSVTGTIVDNTDPLNPVVNVPTLQQVTDAGLQTNDSIKLENGFDIYDSTNLQWIEARGGDGFFALRIAGALQEFFVAEIGQVVIKDGINKTGIVDISNIPASTTKTYKLPNISGASATLVTSVNGTTAGTNGDISISVTGTQDLQSVTTNGNTTTDGIILGLDGVAVYDPFAVNHIEIQGNNGLLVRYQGAVHTLIESDANQFKFGEIIKAILDRTLLTASRTYNMPNANGTLVLSVNGTSPNSLGEITIPVGGTQTLDQTTALGNTSNQSIELINGALLRIEDTASSDLLNIGVNSNTITMQYLISGNRLFELDNNRFSWGNQSTANWVQFRNSNLSVASYYEMPDDSGATFATKVNGVSANAQGEITIPTGASLNLQQVTDNGNTTTNDIALIDASVTGIDNLDFDLTPATTAHSEGRVRWNDNNKTLQIDTENSSVSIDVGHDTIQRVVNNTGATLLKGRVVYINGQQGGRPTVTLADYTTDPTSATTFGIVMADIPNNQNGYVITNGLLGGINTSSYTAGQQLYLGASGALTGTKPVQPLHIVYVAKVISTGLLGSIFVTIQNGLELEELHDCLITSPANGQLLTYESSTGLWKNQNAPTELPTQTGNTGKFLFTNGTSASWNFPNRHYKLGFNNISDYVVNGFSGIQNMGAGTLGMTYTTDLQSMLYSISGSNYVINLKVISYEQYGGVANQLGVAVTYSSANGTFTTNQTASATYQGNFGSNFAYQTVNLVINIPIQYNGANTNYFRFDVIMQRNTGGSTSVYGSEIIFSV